MKKILQFIGVAMLTMTFLSSKAQLSDGSIAPNFTMTDINGNSHTLYSYLNQGKTVIIDISATWCGPCWSYHNSHALEDTWKHHGPLGQPGVDTNSTNDVVVLFIEGDVTTNSADLHGTGTRTAGDWVTGTEYPIFDPTSSGILSMYQLPYYPTIYMICPDRRIKLVGTISETLLYNAKQQDCFSATTAVDAGIMETPSLNDNLFGCDSVKPTFRLCNYGTSVLNSATIELKVGGITQKTYNWSGSLTTYANQKLSLGKVGAGLGSSLVTVEVSNPNGSVDNVTGNNSQSYPFEIISSSPGLTSVSEGFESGIPSGWSVKTFDGQDAKVWKSVSTGYNSSKGITLNFYYTYANNADEIYLPSITSMGSSALSLDFDVAYAQYSSNSQDSLKAYVSLDCGTTWTTVFNKYGSSLSSTGSYVTSYFTPGSSQWRHETVDLSSYVNNADVMVKFRGVARGGNNLYMDNIALSQTTGLNNVESSSSVSIYPNPASDFIAIQVKNKELNSVRIYDILGKQVYAQNNLNINGGNYQHSIDVSSFKNGIYILSILSLDGNIVNEKITISK